MEIQENPNGIYKILDESYPIAYIRLCFDMQSGTYCVPNDCDKYFEMKRKIVVVGMRIYGGVHEQVFYKSTGSNSQDSLSSFFKKSIVGECELWLPFCGLGYAKTAKDPEREIKLSKNHFDCIDRGAMCMFGRFGAREPNLMQISYCLGGKFWDNNTEMVIECGFEIIRCPNISSFFDKVRSACPVNTDELSNVQASVYLNEYIGSALPHNYSPGLLLYKQKILRFFKNNKDFDWKDLKVDFRIVHRLKELGVLKFDFDFELPNENYFTYNYWTNYTILIEKTYKEDKKNFIEKILPIINDSITEKEAKVKKVGKKSKSKSPEKRSPRKPKAKPKAKSKSKTKSKSRSRSRSRSKSPPVKLRRSTRVKK